MSTRPPPDPRHARLFEYIRQEDAALRSTGRTNLRLRTRRLTEDEVVQVRKIALRSFDRLGPEA